MRRYIMYMWYVIRHKWFVFVECVRLGVIWRGIVHDMSKLRLREFIPYARCFYKPDGSGQYVDGPEFDLAWLEHIHDNRHHPAFWVLREDSGSIKVLPMPDVYRREMLADWKGAGKAQGNLDTTGWYRENKDKLKLHPQTREWIEERLSV